MSPMWLFCCSILLLSNFYILVSSQCPNWYGPQPVASGTPGYPPPYPIIIKSKEKDSLKSILPILLLLLNDNPAPSCNCNSCSNSNDSPIPIPYPIPIPMNCPIIY